MNFECHSLQKRGCSGCVFLGRVFRFYGRVFKTRPQNPFFVVIGRGTRLLAIGVGRGFRSAMLGLNCGGWWVWVNNEDQQCWGLWVVMVLGLGW